MARCSCGAELLSTSLVCPSCGRKFTLDINQAGDYESANRVDWDEELARLNRGDLRPARIESATPDQRRPWWRWRRKS